MVVVVGLTMCTTGAPGLTVTWRLWHIAPKQAEITQVPTKCGLNRPVESILPFSAYHSTD